MLTWWLCSTIYYPGVYCITVGEILSVFQVFPRISGVVFSSPDSGSSGKQEVANSFPAALVLYSSSGMQLWHAIKKRNKPTSLFSPVFRSIHSSFHSKPAPFVPSPILLHTTYIRLLLNPPRTTLSIYIVAQTLTSLAMSFGKDSSLRASSSLGRADHCSTLKTGLPG